MTRLHRWTAAARRRLTLVAWRRVATIAGLLSSLGLVVAGIALIYPPAGLIAGGLGLFALLTFDQARASRLTWPR